MHIRHLISGTYEKDTKTCFSLGMRWWELGEGGGGQEKLGGGLGVRSSA